MSFAEPVLDDALERESADKHSILAAGVALIVVIFAVILVDVKWISSLLIVFFVGSGIAMATWAAAYFAALRKGSNWMGLAAFLALLIFSLGGLTFKYWQEYRGSSHESDRSRYKLMDTLYSAPGAIDVVADAGGGSLTIVGRYLNNILADRNLYEKTRNGLGTKILLEVPEIASGEQLSKCTGHAGLRDISAKAKANGHAQAKATKAEIEKSDLGTRQRNQLLAEFAIVQKNYLPMQDRLWDVRAELADAVAQRCRILARKNWQLQRGLITFTNQSDYNGYGAASDKLGKLLGEEVDIQNAALRKTVDELNAL